MENIPADSISALFRYARLPGEAVITDMNEVAAAFFSHELQPVIASMRLTPRAIPTNPQGEHGSSLQAELRGTAILNGKRLVGFMEGDAARGLLWLRGEMRSAVITIPCPDDSDRNMAIEVRNPKVRVNADLKAGLPTFRVTVQTGGWLSEQDCVTAGMDTMDLRGYAEREFQRKIEQSLKQALKVLQQDLRTDALKYGQTLRNQHPVWWRRNQSRWDDLFPQVTTRLSVQAQIPKMGLYTRPMNFDFP
jgi:spore germination protein KC